MRFRQLAAVALLTVAPVAAQAPLPILRIEPATGGSIFYIKNTHTQALTAYIRSLH